MRGEQTGCGIEPLEPAGERVTYVYVLVLVAAYLALILVSVFVMDWFKRGSYGWGFGKQSIDLWVATTCDPYFGCTSTSFERLGWGEFRPYAIITLWTTAMSAVMVLVRTGSYLLGMRAWRHIPVFAFMLLGISAVSVLVTVLDGVPHPDGPATEMTPAPFVLLAAHFVGLLAMACVTGRSFARGVGRNQRLPNARVVKTS